MAYISLSQARTNLGIKDNTSSNSGSSNSYVSLDQARTQLLNANAAKPKPKSQLLNTTQKSVVKSGGLPINNVIKVSKTPIIGQILQYVKTTAEDLGNTLTAPFKQISAYTKIQLDPKAKKELDAIRNSKLPMEKKLIEEDKIMQKYGGQTTQQQQSAQKGAEFGMSLSAAAGNVPMGAIEGNIGFILKQGTGNVSKVLSKIIGKEAKPQEVLNTVIGSTIEKTPEGKDLIKKALQAEKEGKTLMIEAPKVKQLEAPKPKEKVQGEGFTMNKNVDKSKVNITKANNDYQTKLDKYNQNPTPENLKLVQDAKTKLTEAKTTPVINVENVKPQGVKVATEAKTSKPVVNTEVKPQQPITPKTSGVAKQIEAKAVEKGMVEKGYTELAQYDSSTIKAQSQAATKYTIDQHLDFATGKQPLPKELKPGTPLSIAEDYAIKNNDGELLTKLANSPLATQISESASQLSLSRMRDTNSPVKVIRDVLKTKEEAVTKKLGKPVKQIIESESAKIKAKVKIPDKYDWNAFVKSIQC